eukprot:Skav220167  [mRNA]  locus=scaffold564:326407:328827:- [translate_table: standard]
MFTGSACFPTLILYIACCPPSEVVPDEDLRLQCPAEYVESRTVACCGASEDRAGFIFRVIQRVVPQKFQGGSAEERSFVITALWRLLLDYDNNFDDAWHLLVFSTVADACMEADQLKDELKLASDSYQPISQTVKELLPKAERISRRLAKAALRLEDFASFLRAKLAVNSGRSFPEVEHEEIYSSLFDNTLMEYYKHVVREHDELAYSVIPTLLDSQRAIALNQTLSGPINLLFLNVGRSAKLGFTTLWSILRHRTQALRIFVVGDAVGIEDWQANLRVLEQSGKSEYLRMVHFEYVDLAKNNNFQNFMRMYPRGCGVNDIGEALLARFVCHEILPTDVHRVIATDLADVLVLDDVKDLWAQFDTFEPHHVFAAAHITALHHVNGGLALYDLDRMRASNWTSIALDAARSGLERSNDCIHDQSLMNSIHLHRSPSEGLTPMKTLPCRWMLVPATDWQMFWNSPEMVLPEVRERRRYPGLVSASHFEVYCPDLLDRLSGWTFLLSSSSNKRRLRTILLHGNSRLIHCSRDGTAGFVPAREAPPSRCCQCGEKVSLVHIPGDMKQWAFVDILFRFHSPFSDWQEKELQTSLTKKLWHKESRFAEHSGAIRDGSGRMAELYGGEVCFARDKKSCCATHIAARASKEARVLYKTLNLKSVAPPFRLEVDSTATADGHMMIGTGPWNSLEVVFGADGGAFSAVRWATGQNFVFLTAFESSPQKDSSSETWKAQIQLDEDGQLTITHGWSEWGVYIPDYYLEILRQSPVQIYAGMPGDLSATWTVCREDLSKCAHPVPIWWVASNIIAFPHH